MSARDDEPPWFTFRKVRVEVERGLPSLFGSGDDIRYAVLFGDTVIGHVVGRASSRFEGFDLRGRLVAVISGSRSRDRAAEIIAYEMNLIPEEGSGRYQIEITQSGDKPSRGPILFSQRECGSPGVMRFAHRLAPARRLSPCQIRVLRQWCRDQWGPDGDCWASLGSVFCFRDAPDAVHFLMRWSGQEIAETLEEPDHAAG
jgi:hypothetical protein